MNTSNKRLPRHCHHKATGQGYVRLNGRFFYTGSWGSAESDRRYERLVAEWLAHGRMVPEQPLAGDSYLVQDLMADYWRHAETYYRKNGELTQEVENIRYALRPLRALYEDLPAVEFGPAKLKVYREKLIEQGLCRNLINQRVGIVKRTFRWGAEEEKVPGSVAQALLCVRGLRKGRSAARETKPVQPVTEAQMKAVLPHLSRQVGGMVQLQWLTGMRPGEVVQMRWADLDREGPIWLYRPPSHKTEHHGKARVIPLGPLAQVVLQSFPKLDPKAPIFSPIDADQEHREEKRRKRKTKVQPSQRARDERRRRSPRRNLQPQYDIHAYRRAIVRACNAAKVDRWSPNQLRHAAATRIRREYGLDAARALLGHTSPAVTEVYAELDLAQARRIMERVG